MIDTPRVDRYKAEVKGSPLEANHAWGVARQLERELTRQVNAVNALNEDCKYLEEKLKQARDDALEEVAKKLERRMDVLAENGSSIEPDTNAAVWRNEGDEAAWMELSEQVEEIRALKNNAAQAAQNAAGHSEGTQQQTHEADVPASKGNQAASRPDAPAAPEAAFRPDWENYRQGREDGFAEGREVTDEMVSRFLSWPLPKTFAPDCGISFDGRKPDQWNADKGWPVGTNLFTADEARQMLGHVLAAAPARKEET